MKRMEEGNVKEWKERMEEGNVKERNEWKKLRNKKNLGRKE